MTRVGNYQRGPRKPEGVRKGPYRPMVGGRKEHTVVAERALGRPLRHPELVHHVNCDKTDNSPGNLVICSDQTYHGIIERRGRALRECGNANWKKCFVCKYWDEPAHLIIWIDKRRPGNWYAKHRRVGKCLRGPSAILGKTQKRAKRMSAYGDREIGYPDSQSLPPGYRVVWLEATEHYHWIDGDRRSEPIAGDRYVVRQYAWADHYRKSHA